MTILVAGIGNIFLGDDGFGVEVVRRLATRPAPEGVSIRDFGIRGYDLAFALDTADTIILVDAVSRGGAPGTVYTIEPDLDDLGDAADGPDGHAMDPVSVLRLAKQMNVLPGHILLVGCELQTFGPENEGQMGLSAPVQAAIDPAITVIEGIWTRLGASRAEEFAQSNR